VIEQAINTCQVQLVIIGTEWLDARFPNGERRLDDTTDFVRLEVETGLRCTDILLVPVLVSGARLPTADELPTSLRELVFRNALAIRDDPDFRGDMQRLIDSLRRRDTGRRDRFRRFGVMLIATLIFAGAILVITARTVANWYRGTATAAPTVIAAATEVPSIEAPANVDALLRQGERLQDQGRSEDSLALYDQAIQLDPDNPESYYRRGNAYHMLGDHTHALEDLTTAIELDPSDPENYRERGWIRYDQGEYEESIADFDRAIELDLRAASGYMGRGSAYRELQDFDHAIADLSHAISLDANFGEVYYQRGYTYELSGDYEAAFADYQHAVELNPRDGYALQQMASIEFYKLDEPEAALEHALRAVELAPDNPWVYALLGDIYYAAGRNAEALAQYQHHVELIGDGADPQYLALIRELEESQ
jgi:tetratricopeptide (TPR) repeat protein